MVGLDFWTRFCVSEPPRVLRAVKAEFLAFPPPSLLFIGLWPFGGLEAGSFFPVLGKFVAELWFGAGMCFLPLFCLLVLGFHALFQVGRFQPPLFPPHPVFLVCFLE